MYVCASGFRVFARSIAKLRCFLRFFFAGLCLLLYHTPTLPPYKARASSAGTFESARQLLREKQTLSKTKTLTENRRGSPFRSPRPEERVLRFILFCPGAEAHWEGARPQGPHRWQAASHRPRPPKRVHSSVFRTWRSLLHCEVGRHL